MPAGPQPTPSISVAAADDANRQRRTGTKTVRAAPNSAHEPTAHEPTENMSKGVSRDASALEDLEERLARFYDQEAPQRLKRPLPAERIGARDAFVRLLATEDRQRVLDVGAGAGHDAVALTKAGLRVAAIDLSTQHAAMCRRRGIDALVASARRLPFLDNTFDAGWTMSTLLHIPDSGIDSVLQEIRRVLRPGAPLAVGLWGGDDREHVVENDRFDPPRFFAIRSDEAVGSLLARHGTVESFATWPSGFDPEEHYQFAVVRT